MFIDQWQRLDEHANDMLHLTQRTSVRDGCHHDIVFTRQTMHHLGGNRLEIGVGSDAQLLATTIDLISS